MTNNGNGKAGKAARWGITPLIWCFSGTAVSLLCIALLMWLPHESVSRALRFFSFRDGVVRDGVPGTMLLALNCAVLGTLLISRRMAMLGDTLSHAVLPGIAAGFLWTMSRNPAALIAGAILTGVLSSLIVSWITSTTRLKPDAALSVVLTVFFAAGIALIKMLPDGNKAGLDRFLYGQAAAMGTEDTVLLAITAGVTLLSIALCYRGFLVLAFDETFGRAAGLPMRALHYAQMFFTTLAIVVSMQAVGVLLVAGLLIIPASTAWLFSARLHRVLWISAGLGMAAALLGSFLAFTGDRMAGGATLVLCAGVMFAAAFLFSPRYGLARRIANARADRRRILREDTLKAAYRTLEQRRFDSPLLRAEDIASAGFDARTARRAIWSLDDAGLAVLQEGSGTPFQLSPAGFREAARIVRNHRLWELYLTQRAGYAEDHVHDDAERMEHILAEENISALLRVLGPAANDPHGKPIPSPEDTFAGTAARLLPKGGAA